MPFSHLPALLTSTFRHFACWLQRRSAVRLPLLPCGLLFAHGRRTVTHPSRSYPNCQALVRASVVLVTWPCPTAASRTYFQILPWAVCFCSTRPWPSNRYLVT